MAPDQSPGLVQAEWSRKVSWQRRAQPVAKKATTPEGAVEFREETPTTTIGHGSNIIVFPVSYKSSVTAL
jgi:hypothetical protein